MLEYMENISQSEAENRYRMFRYRLSGERIGRDWNRNGAHP